MKDDAHRAMEGNVAKADHAKDAKTWSFPNSPGVSPGVSLGFSSTSQITHASRTTPSTPYTPEGGPAQIEAERKYGCEAHNGTFPCPACNIDLFCTECYWLRDKGCGVGIRCDWVRECRCAQAGSSSDAASNYSTTSGATNDATTDDATTRRLRALDAAERRRFDSM